MSDRNILNMEDDTLVFECEQELINRITNIIIQKTSEDEMKLVLIDFKGRFDCFTDDPHLYIPPIKDWEKQVPFFDWLYAEIRQRLEMLAKEGLTNLEQYNDAHPEEKQPYILVLLSEIDDMDLQKNTSLVRSLLNDDNAGVYFIAFSEGTREDSKLGTDLNLFKTMEYEELAKMLSEA